MTDETKTPEKKLDKKEYLSQFFDAVVNNDQEKMDSSYAAYAELKTAPIVKSIRENVEPSPIRLKGDGVFINDKKIGTTLNDTNKNSGINFKSLDGKVTKEFDTIKGLYDYLVKEYNITSEMK